MTEVITRNIVIVSNREPYVHEKTGEGWRCRKTAGGLVSALDPMMQSQGRMWIAWGGGSGDFIVLDQKGMIKVPPDDPKYLLKRLKLSAQEVRDYYRGFSNSILWPLCHNFIEKISLRPEYWSVYWRVNKKFANAVVEEMGQDDLIWVHDYHLALAPKFIRERDKDARIALFWHIPWPPWETYSTLPWRKEILEGILESDLIGFHTESYVKNFVDCVRNELNIEFDLKEMTIASDRRSMVKSFPLGIDSKVFSSTSHQIERRADVLRKKIGVPHIVLGVDRLDYTKGIVEKLKAFERFLEKHSEFQGRVTLIQLATPSRSRVQEYIRLKREVDENVGRVVGRFGRVNWTPVLYFYRTHSFEQLLVFYKIANVALLTPLADGMNIVAKEYVAARDDGVLILSEFAGASEQMNKAILVNPYDIEQVADALRESLVMPLEERKKRFQALKHIVEKYDLDWWTDKFLHDWKEKYRRESKALAWDYSVACSSGTY